MDPTTVQERLLEIFDNDRSFGRTPDYRRAMTTSLDLSQKLGNEKPGRGAAEPTAALHMQSATPRPAPASLSRALDHERARFESAFPQSTPCTPRPQTSGPACPSGSLTERGTAASGRRGCAVGGAGEASASGRAPTAPGDASKPMSAMEWGAPACATDRPSTSASASGDQPAALRRLRPRPNRALRLERLPTGAAGAQLIDLAQTLEVPPFIEIAAGRFADRHEKYTRSAGRHLRELSYRPHQLSSLQGFHSSVVDMRQNRLPADAPVDVIVSAYRRRKRTRKKHDLDNTVWAERKKSGNARAYFETDEAMRRTFKADWKASLVKLDRLIQQAYTMAAPERFKRGGIEEFKEQVQDALFAEWQILYGSFDYYGVHSSFEGNSPADVFNITMQAFLSFTRTCSLASAECPSSKFENFFVMANAPVLEHEDRRRSVDRFKKVRELNREEWLQCLVRIAFEKYRAAAEVHLVDAIALLFKQDLAPRLPPAALQDSNEWRARQCYHPQVSFVLKRHVNSLRALFVKYANLHDHQAQLDSRQMLSCGEWLELIDHLGFFHTKQLSAFDAKLIFCWSRHRVVDGYSRAAHSRMRHLTFEDFLEALVRLSSMISLPNDEELREAGAADAGEFMMTLEATHRATFLEFVFSHTQSWRKQTRQPIWRCVDHLVHIIVRTVEGNTSRGVHSAEDMRVSEQEARDFAKRFQGEKDTSKVRTVHKKIEMCSVAVMEQVARIRQRLVDGLAKIPVFKCFSDAERQHLIDALSEAPHEEGEYVFEQGEEGDAFYVILSGTAEVIRDEDTDDERLLATLGEGACFGERALLRGEPRYASVKAASDLRALCITREDFEAKFGPLTNRLPDDYA